MKQHYAHSLKDKITAEERINRKTLAALTEFRLYLSSSKFHEDTTIQVQDVHNRLDNISAALKGIQ
jgi:hypothetical protein|tara:strand:- start:1800 stop:1997 length:198 start_codon:yes stop_codon:yes gene_type:complete